MTKIIRLWEQHAEMIPHSPIHGKYLVEYDPYWLDKPVQGSADYALLIRKLEVTDDINKAKRFDDGAVFDVWRAVSPNKPVRPDGKPNRPLTAFHVEILPAPGA